MVRSGADQCSIEDRDDAAILFWTGYAWGSMINEVLSELVLGKWWQLATTALLMSTFVVAFGLFTDVLRDALDPKMKRN